MKLSGIVSNRQGFDKRDRVVAVWREQQVLDEVQLDSSGQWSLEVKEFPSWIFAQLSGARIAATTTPVAEVERIEMPQLIQLELKTEEMPEGVMVFIDPVGIQGFPHNLLWALRTHSNHIVDLHVGEFSMNEGSLKLAVQAGEYRLSGGRISIHPSVNDRTIHLSRVTDKITGESFDAVGGQVAIEIDKQASYQLIFESTNA